MASIATSRPTPLLSTFTRKAMFHKGQFAVVRRQGSPRPHLLVVNSLGKNAVVLGGSMSGLGTARVLSDYFENVYVIERDVPPQTAIPRQGCWQGRHLHVLLPAGMDVYEALFPGFMKDLAGVGAVEIDWQTEFAKNIDGRWTKNSHIPVGPSFPRSPLPKGSRYYSASRPVFEYVVRNRTSELTNVHVITGTYATGFMATPDGRGVSGVKYVHKDTNQKKEISAALVVDACGRSSPSPEWLAELGFEAPQKEVVDAKMKYSDLVIRPPPEVMQKLGVKFFSIEQSPKTGGRSCIGTVIENGLCKVTVGAYMEIPPPSTLEQWMAFAKELPDPFLYDLVSRSEILTPEPMIYRGTCNQWRHFETMPVQPAGFLAIGDAVLAPNPVYGQGMSFAALEVEALQKVLAAHADGADANATLYSPEKPLAAEICREAQQKIAVRNLPYFNFVVGADSLRLPADQVPKPVSQGGIVGFIEGLVMAYITILMNELMFEEEAAALQFVKVMAHMEPPTNFVTPELVFKALVLKARQRLSAVFNGAASANKMPQDKAAAV